VVFFTLPGVVKYKGNNLPGCSHIHAGWMLGYIAVGTRQIALLRDEKSKFNGKHTFRNIITLWTRAANK